MGTRRGRTPAFGRMARLIVGALAVAAVVTTSALAGTIVGTAKNDTIRGTARADKLYGRGGNDSLFGMAGGDYLNGGPGKDRFSCGAGRDTVVAEKGESVARDCEVVRRTGGTTPTPPPTTPAPPTPPPPAPRRRRLRLRRQGRVLRRLREHRRQRHVRRGGRRAEPSTSSEIDYQAECTAPARVSTGDRPTAAPSRSEPTGRSPSTGAGTGTTVKFSGTFAADGSTVAGRFQIHVSFDYQGTHYECDSGGADWSAKWQG